MMEHETWEREVAMIREDGDRRARAMAKRRIILLEDPDGTWRVSNDDRRGVAPQASYPSADKAIARIMQLADVPGPILAQTWPERVCLSDDETPPPEVAQ